MSSSMKCQIHNCIKDDDQICVNVIYSWPMTQINHAHFLWIQVNDKTSFTLTNIWDNHPKQW